MVAFSTEQTGECHAGLDLFHALIQNPASEKPLWDSDFIMYFIPAEMLRGQKSSTVVC